MPNVLPRLVASFLIAATATAGAQTPVRKDAPAPNAPNAPNATAARRPRLVMLMVVDQLREPLLERYDDLFTGGFRRLIDRGRFYTRATHDHALTETAVGHATLATGVYPMRHGIVANEWSERTPKGWLEVSNVGDSTVRIVGQDELPGVSPHYLRRTGLADWITAANPRSQVASVSAKDRGAVLPAGRAKGQVYWFDNGSGRFVTSSYYRDAYPAWVTAFNDAIPRRYGADSVWASRIPAAALGRSMADTAAFEGDGVHTAFPHRFADEGKAGKFWDWYARTPMLDATTLDFARTLVTSMQLGTDDAPDFLNVSLSQTDRVGHDYSPLSREQLDNLLRLDRALGDFFAFLDETIGADGWTMALSADHGSLIAPEHLALGSAAGTGEPRSAARSTAAQQATLDSLRHVADRDAADPRAPARLVAALERLPYVADAWTDASLLRAQPDSFAVLERRSLYPGRAGREFTRYGVEVRFTEGRLDRERGSGHGTPYWYDRHVPVILMGAGIPAAHDRTRVATVDVAPTLATLLGIRFPGDLDGKPLRAVVAGRR